MIASRGQFSRSPRKLLLSQPPPTRSPDDLSLRWRRCTGLVSTASVLNPYAHWDSQAYAPPKSACSRPAGAVLGADKGNRFREACGPPLGDGIFNSLSPLHLWWGLHAGDDSITQVLPFRLGDDDRRGCDPWRQLPRSGQGQPAGVMRKPESILLFSICSSRVIPVI